jgi:hypothetical protein
MQRHFHEDSNCVILFSVEAMLTEFVLNTERLKCTGILLVFVEFKTPYCFREVRVVQAINNAFVYYFFMDWHFCFETSFYREVVCGPTIRVFLSSDLVGQTYLCYLVPTLSQLFCARLEKANKEQKLIFGVVKNITAKDAAPLPVSICFA